MIPAKRNFNDYRIMRSYFASANFDDASDSAFDLLVQKAKEAQTKKKEIEKEGQISQKDLATGNLLKSMVKKFNPKAIADRQKASQQLKEKSKELPMKEEIHNSEEEKDLPRGARIAYLAAEAEEESAFSTASLSDEAKPDVEFLTNFEKFQRSRVEKEHKVQDENDDIVVNKDLIAYIAGGATVEEFSYLS